MKDNDFIEKGQITHIGGMNLNFARIINSGGF